MKILADLLTPNEQKILLYLTVFALLGLLVGKTFLTAEEEQPPAQVDFASDYPLKYDLQTATLEELITIPGIGPKRAADIIEYRQKHGFQNKIDLLQIKGIGNATYQKIEVYFHDLGETEITAAKQELPAPQETSTSDNQLLKININTADVQELTKLTGIGPAKAERIIALRQELGKFTSIQDLLQVKGIGPKTLEKMQCQISLGE